MRFKIGLAALTFLAPSSTAFATNMPVKKSKAPAVTVTPKMADAMPAPLQPAFSWAGPYIGASAGYGFGAKLTGSTDGTGGTGFNDASGVVGGVYGGANLQFDKFVFGGEVDLDAASLSSDKTWNLSNGSMVNTKTSINKIGSIRGRIAYSMDQLLIYGFGGAAMTDFKISVPTNNNYEATKSYTGYTVGAGLDIKLTNQLIGRLEYSYYDFGKATYPQTSADIGLTASAVRGGLAYKF
jgi:outer membrane immunogenic protein